MKLILTQDVDNLGERGEIVQVKDGYGRNYLIPRGLARIANKGNIAAIEEERRQAGRKIAQAQEEAKSLAERLENTQVTVAARVGEESRIFGSITTQQLADALAEKGIEIDRRKIEINEEVRTLGVYSADARLSKDVTATFKFRVEDENPEAPEAEEETEAESETESESESEEA